jgi:formate-dependent nitrite reductase membrane component NrfD
VDTDLMMVVGIVLGALTLPAFLNGYTEGRAPKTAIILAVAAGALIVMAVMRSPGGYTLDEIVQAFGKVFARFTG